jgi:hypothetical protein
MRKKLRSFFRGIFCATAETLCARSILHHARALNMAFLTQLQNPIHPLLI